MEMSWTNFSNLKVQFHSLRLIGFIYLSAGVVDHSRQHSYSGHAGETTSLGWPGSNSEYSLKKCRKCCPGDPVLDKVEEDKKQ